MSRDELFANINTLSMKKRILVFLPIFLIVTGTLLFLRFSSIFLKGEGGLQVTANMKSKVYLDGRQVGETPFCRGCNKEQNSIKEGEYLLKLEPEDTSLSPFSFKISIGKGILTAVDRTFLPGSAASAYILTLEKIDKKEPQLLIATLPEAAFISVDNKEEDLSPFLLKGVSPSQHSVEIHKVGFNKKTLRVQTVPSYKLVAYIILGTQTANEAHATASATLTPKVETRVKINDTPTGFLRVRQEPSTASQELGRVQPGKTYPYLEEQNGWFKIKLSDGSMGWISSTFSEKITPP